MTLDERPDRLQLEPHHRLLPGAIARTLPSDAGQLAPLRHLVDQRQAYPEQFLHLLGIQEVVHLLLLLILKPYMQSDPVRGRLHPEHPRQLMLL